ncbi:ImmA/IrrE family metallo-endopeptidase [Fibrobacter intestinalis]|uniref:Uncharacterized protein n=1 Tax=Fibrobacter intestinalis TaxID=28122 RepID=A0A1T4K938_9BACT|nr:MULTISPECIES: ImmA/IrrE family metallo-endopeptidase [Fibrobacter]PBC74947.1 uncharacterized protein DUF955 [Fibrobacter sp. NR9]SJZ38825.1 protein of unknown function [Fibrobacter intestinalis]
MNVKIYASVQLEEFANIKRKAFLLWRPHKNSAVDVYDFVDFVGCEPDWKYITPDQSILGCVCFGNTTLPTWEDYVNKQSKIPEFNYFPRGTIVIDQALNEGNDRGKENYTVVHECFHWLLHQYYFSSDDSDVVHTCGHNAFSIFGCCENDSAANIIEWQANYAAACFLMPQEEVTRAFIKRLRLKNFPHKPLEMKRWINAHIALLAKQFGVNFNPMKYRLRELKLIQ